MENQKKIYIPPEAELLLLTPMEALANTEDNATVSKWWGSKGSMLNTASAVNGKNVLIWGEDGRITTK